jgi:hypothetical protein
MDIPPRILVPVLPGTLYGVVNMSMPSFPPNGADLTREEALNMIIASIAMEELALSHILNAEGEKLQYILGTLPGTKPCAYPQDVLAVNKSVTALVEAVTQNQMLLKNKLSQALEFCPIPPTGPPPCQPEPSPCPPHCRPDPVPCPPPCHPDPVPCPPVSHRKHTSRDSALQLTARREETLWNPGSRLLWRKQSQSGKAIRWDECAPTEIYLSPGKTYTVQCTLNVRTVVPAKGTGIIFLRQSPCGMFTNALPLCFPMEYLAQGPQSLCMTAVLHPCSDCGCETYLSLLLDAKSALCVEGAVMDVAELP